MDTHKQAITDNDPYLTEAKRLGREAAGLKSFGSLFAGVDMSQVTVMHVDVDYDEEETK